MIDRAPHEPTANATDALPPGWESQLRFGVCGWDFADWDGPLYPKPRPKGYRALPFLATFLDFVEVNATFYHPMGGDASVRWLEETPPEFTFVLKAFRGWSHDKLEPGGEELARFREVLDPILEQDRLDGVLVQFPPWVRTFDGRLKSRLRKLVQAFSPASLFVEVRDSALYRTDFFDFLTDEGIAFVNVDLPDVASLPKLTSINTTAQGYIRLHGRNHAGWADPRATRDVRYDYSYTARDLDQVIEKIEKLAARTRTISIAANNHFRAQAPAALLACRERLGLPRPRAKFPPAFDAPRGLHAPDQP